MVDIDLLQDVKNVLIRYPVQPGSLKLEITETLAIGATNAMTFKADFDAMKVPRIASLLPNLRLAE